LIAATFLGFLGFGSVLPGLAPHVRHDLGGSLHRAVAINRFAAHQPFARVGAQKRLDRFAHTV